MSNQLDTGKYDREVLGIYVDFQYHVTCLVEDDDDGVGGEKFRSHTTSS